MRTLACIVLLASCGTPRPKEDFDKKYLVVIRQEQTGTSMVSAIIKPILDFLIP